MALVRLSDWAFPGLLKLVGDLVGTGLNIIAQLDFFPHFSERNRDPLDLHRAIMLGWFVLHPFRSFQSVSHVLPLGGQLGDGLLQALAVGLQVRNGFDLVVDQELRYGDVSVQLENILPQEVGRPLDALGVVLDRAQQNAILEVQGPEAGELFRRLPGHFVSALLDQ